ncbi:MAG: L-arabinose isomerase [Oscillospiraceae bacterium]|nr:L-arabinose isomerase [Oscillospiraceae bacterium]
MKKINEAELWLLAGSQFLYGQEVLDAVAERAAEMADTFNASGHIPCKIVYKATVKTADGITNVIRAANADERCIGVVTWMHTFSPSKMWISGLLLLQKPYCHMHTQYNRGIPDREIDMNFMNLNQSAHGDREHGFIGARMRLPRKIAVGYWRDEALQKQLGSFARTCFGLDASRNLSVVRFGDNMRHVAVTEGDKVEAQIKFGWQVNTQPVGRLAEEVVRVADAEADELAAIYRERYRANTDDWDAVRYQAKEEIAIKRILESERAGAFSNTFEDLYGLEQLPGLATQRLMEQGYGYGGEGDWKTAALVHIVKMMTQGLTGGTSFMEDYTYDLTAGSELCLGAHMLEVCPSIAGDRPKIEVHPLGIGGKNPPARLVFEGKEGKAVLASLVDMGGRFRMIIHDIEAVRPVYEMPNLPVARVMWKPAPDLYTGAHAWILAGGAHHTVMSYDATADILLDLCEMLGIEAVHITADTTVENLKKELLFADIAWKIRF